ncbi:hypothetical protein IGI58_003656, partial [Enterococcus sp. AZ020]
VDDVDYELQMMDIEQGQTYPDGEYSNLGGESNGKDPQVE